MPLDVIEEYLDSLREIYTVQVSRLLFQPIKTPAKTNKLGIRSVEAQLQQLLE